MPEPYTIRRGDTLSGIAAKNGISLAQLMKWNPVFRSNPKYRGGNRIWAGGKVNLGPPSMRRPTAPEVSTPFSPPPPRPTVTTPTPSPNPTPVNPEDALKGQDRDAYVALKGLFESYGLGSLAPKILEYVQQGYGSDTITILLQRTDEYKKRFAANETRRAKGMPVLSPQEYLATEQSYRQLMRASGLPAGFYDSPTDFENFLANDVSPTELKGRVDLANQATALANPEMKEALKQMGIGGPSVTAYFLDPNRATTLIQKQISTAQIGAAALKNNLQFNQQRAEELALQGVTADQAQQGFGAISGFLGDVEKLGQIYGQEYDQATAEAEIFSDSGEAANKRKRLASQERAQFGGATGSARVGLGTQRNV